MGYRWYDARHIEPLYPFGYGLSYTTFAITDVAAEKEVNVDQSPINVKFKVKNTGSIAGSEVVQVYVRDVECKFDRPEKELKGFQKIFLQPGEEQCVTIQITKSDLAGYYMEFGEWITQPGEFDLLVGTSVADIACTKRVLVKCKDPFRLSGRTSIGVIAQNPRAVEILNRIMEDDILLLTHVALEFAPDKPLSELWNGANIQDALKAKGWSKSETVERYNRILQEFEQM